MGDIVKLKPNQIDAEEAARIAKIKQATMLLVDTLTADGQQEFLDQMIVALRPIAAPRAGNVLEAIVKLLPRKPTWTVGDIKQEVSAKGVSASPKEVYNAVGYLTRMGHMRRVGYGRYVVDGMEVVTSDDLGGPTASHEDAYRVD